MVGSVFSLFSTVFQYRDNVDLTVYCFVPKQQRMAKSNPQRATRPYNASLARRFFSSSTLRNNRDCSTPLPFGCAIRKLVCITRVHSAVQRPPSHTEPLAYTYPVDCLLRNRKKSFCETGRWFEIRIRIMRIRS